MLTLTHLKLYIHIKKKTKHIKYKEAQTKTFLNDNAVGFGYRYAKFFNSDAFRILLFTNYIRYNYCVDFMDGYRVIEIYYIKKHSPLDYNLIYANHNIYSSKSNFVFHGTPFNIGNYKIILPNIPRYNLKSNVSEKLYNRRR